ncbi:PEP-CTERM sorting domain-containing protein [Lacipirellula limnantheis]|uniref:Ice-binding protein C-terminal domain-containing protein n=1 Tax=Lacipirellula limnantheis TaxID=2528024 RepID=A0A517TRJ9_9BACT|nr:PEP-CTERM sorting domain-containing protein [Lacipirellula limnantheis]QDT71001.1 hypothetical protein I41_01560 [Lacipirellula limnantheis]
MRELLFFLLAVLPAVAAQAEPYGLYDPATGDVLVGGLYGHLSATLHSTAGRLRPELLSEPPVFSPSNAQAPLVLAQGSLPGYWIVWHMPWPPHTHVTPLARLEVNSISLRAAVPPRTPTIDLSLQVSDGITVLFSRLLQVPEPNSLIGSGIALLSLAALRRRK